MLAGLEAALEFVQAFRYQPDELEFLARIRDYDAAFLDALESLRFTGEILAMPEGTIAFPMSRCCASPRPSARPS